MCESECTGTGQRLSVVVAIRERQCFDRMIAKLLEKAAVEIQFVGDHVRREAGQVIVVIAMTSDGHQRGLGECPDLGFVHL